MTFRHRVLAACTLWIVGCSTENDDPIVVAHDASTDAAAATPDSGCAAGQVTACTCPAEDGGTGAAGTQQCFQGSWLLCNCQRVDTTPVDTAGECLAGYYEGAFEGEYRSGFQFGGSLKVSGDLNLTLSQTKEGEGEFATFTISAGKVTGKANDRFPFEGTLTGDLDCRSKEFVGVLEGCYQVVQDLSGLAQGCFKGPMNAKYDAQSKSFVAGTWDVLEPDTVIFQMLGGNGTWQAPYTSPDAPAVADGGAQDAGAQDGGTSDAG